MKSRNAFVYVVCGNQKHIKTLHRSINWLEGNANSDIIVVTDVNRNEIPVIHRNIVHVQTPPHFTNHQASIYLKTSLCRHVPPGYEKYCYLDSDVLAVSEKADQIFTFFVPPVTFAPDLPIAENNVSRFSPWAVNCTCTGVGETASCMHLIDAISLQFRLQVTPDWVHWNGGVFLFHPQQSAVFMEEWHQLTMQIFKDTYWQTRDQGTLIATVWKYGLQNHPMLPQKFNFIADVNNAYLCFSPLEGYALKPELPKTEPILLHLFHSDLHNPNWSLKTDVEQILVKRTFQTDPKRQKQISQHWLSEHFRQHGFIKGLSPLVKRILIEMALKKKKLYP